MLLRSSYFVQWGIVVSVSESPAADSSRFLRVLPENKNMAQWGTDVTLESRGKSRRTGLALDRGPNNDNLILDRTHRYFDPSVYPCEYK